MLSDTERGQLTDLEAVLAEAVQVGDLLGHVRAWLAVAEGWVRAEDRFYPTAKGERVRLKDWAVGRCRDCAHYRADPWQPTAGRCAVKWGGWYGIWATFGCVRDFTPSGTGCGMECEPVLEPGAGA